MMDILFVEDEEHAVVGLKALLQEKGHCVDVAGSADEAVECMRKKKYELIVLDIMIPSGKILTGVPFRETGKDLLLQLRSKKLGKLKTDKNVNVVVITAVSEVGIRIALDGAGSIHIIDKPIDPELVMSRIKDLIGN